MKNLYDTKISVVGLGYVGLPLALKFGIYFHTIGIDLDVQKVLAYKNQVDPNCELDKSEFLESNKVNFTTNVQEIADTDIVIICVPTPISEENEPNLQPLIRATQHVGDFLKRGMTVVFESTVYPGVTEEICVPILEESSKLTWKKDFFVGYSPERINPGDKDRTLSKIVKVVSGDTPTTLKMLNQIYSTIIDAGVHNAPSIKVAEAAKVIENTQRDLNIALMNEFSIVFKRLNINTHEVLAAANTKWNFLPFKPGLVGGHCIGVDPYYITHKAKAVGYNPKVILAGRELNDQMHKYLCNEILSKLQKKNTPMEKMEVCVFGITFKKNCADVRNTGVYKLVSELTKNGLNVSVHDPLASTAECKKLYNIDLMDLSNDKKFDCLIFAVDHDYYSNLPISLFLYKLNKGGSIFDLNSMLSLEKLTENEIDYWQL